MPRLIVGTNPRQVAWRNPKRRVLSVQFLPTSVIAGNSGIVYGKFGSPPKADANSNTWDFALSTGAADGANINESLPKSPEERDLWLVSDTGDEVVNVVELNINGA